MDGVPMNMAIVSGNSHLPDGRLPMDSSSGLMTGHFSASHSMSSGPTPMSVTLGELSERTLAMNEVSMSPVCPAIKSGDLVGNMTRLSEGLLEHSAAHGEQQQAQGGPGDVSVAHALSNLHQRQSSSEDDKAPIQKRRRSVLTLQQKLEVIERIKKGEKVTKLAAEYGVGKATVSDLKRQEDKITAFMSKMATTNSQKRKTMRKPQDERVEKALHIWLTRERKKGTQISGPLLMEKAKAFHKQLYGEDNDKFKASTGWLHRFKLRNGIKHQKTSRRKVIPDTETNSVQAQLDKLRTLIQERCLCPDHIYTADKSRLHWRALPFNPNGGKKVKHSKDSILVLGCSNATGNHKLRLALIGRPKLLRCFGNARLEKMPYRYYAQEDGWMDSDVFSEWFHNEFVTSVRAYYEGGGVSAKALLLVEDVPLPMDGITLQSDDGNIQCVAIPNITAFVTQPINCSLFENVKRNYRKQLILRAVNVHSSKRPSSRLTDVNRWIGIKDAGYMLSEAWGGVSVATIRRVWRDTLYCLGAMDEQAVVVDELLKKVDENNPIHTCGTIYSLVDDAFEIAGLLKDYDKNVSEEDIANWLSIDADDSANQMPMSDREIIDSVKSEHAVGSDSEDESDDHRAHTRRSEIKADPPVHVPSDAEAYTCFTKCLLWLECQADCEPTNLQLLWRLQNMAAQKRKLKR